jgi:flagellin
MSRTLSSVEFNGTSLLNATTDFVFQVGANSGQTITVASADISIDTNASVSGVIGGTNSGSLDEASAAANSSRIGALDDALTAINSIRANLGAVQSRFDNTVTFLRTASENQSAARGRIMDADFAVETSNLSRAQILQQAGTAMIAQANQLPQGVLALLR